MNNRNSTSAVSVKLLRSIVIVRGFVQLEYIEDILALNDLRAQ